MQVSQGYIYNYIEVGYTNYGSENSISGLSLAHKICYIPVSNNFYYYMLDKKDYYDYLVIKYSGYYPESGGKLTIHSSHTNPSNNPDMTLFYVILMGTIRVCACITIIFALCCKRRKNCRFFHNGTNLNAANPPMVPADQQQPFINNGQNQNYQPNNQNTVEPIENLYNKPIN